MEALKTVRLPQEKALALREFVDGLVTAYPRDIDEIILFGSYARGDFREESDIDVLVAARLPDNQVRSVSPFWLYAVKLADDIDYKYRYTIGISPRVVGKDFNTRWSPLWENVRREGIILWEKTTRRKMFA